MKYYATSLMWGFGNGYGAIIRPLSRPPTFDLSHPKYASLKCGDISVHSQPGKRGREIFFRDHEKSSLVCQVIERLDPSVESLKSVWNRHYRRSQDLSLQYLAQILRERGERHYLFCGQDEGWKDVTAAIETGNLQLFDE
jgi:hypothetical protein